MWRRRVSEMARDAIEPSRHSIPTGALLGANEVACLGRDANYCRLE